MGCFHSRVLPWILLAVLLWAANPAYGKGEDSWRLALAYYNAGEYAQALIHFEAYGKKFPAFSPVFNNLGMCMVKLGRIDEGIICLRKAVDLDQRNIEARYNLARSLTATGRLAEADHEYTTLLRHAPVEWKAIVELAYIRERRGDHAGALNAVSDIPEGVDGDPGEYFYNMGLGAWENGDLPGARTGFRLALAINPRNYFARLSSGVVRYQEENYPGALREFKQAAKLKSDDPELLRYMGLAYEKLGENEEASQEFRRSNDLLAGPAPAADEKKGQFADAVLRDEAAALLSAAEHYINRGDRERGLQFLKKLLEMEPDNAEAHYLMGSVHLSAYEYSQARKSFDRARELHRRSVQ